MAGALFSPIAGRLRGIYLGLASLGLVFLGQHILLNATPVTGGFNGRDVAPFNLFGFSFTAGNPDLVGLQCAVRRAGAAVVPVPVPARHCRLVRPEPAAQPARAGLSRAYATVAVAAAVMGVDVRRYRAAAFTVSSGYAGLAGVLFALAFGRIVPDSFGFAMSIDFLAMIILGGLGSVPGSVAGAVLVTALPLVISHYSGALGFLAQPGEPGVGAADAARLLYGAAVVAVLLFAPGGLAQLVPTAREHVARRNRPHPSVSPPDKETSDEANARGGYRPVPDPDRM